MSDMETLARILGPLAENMYEDARKVAWGVTGYTNKMLGSQDLQKVQEAVDCHVAREQGFYKPYWNAVDKSQYFVRAVMRHGGIGVEPSPALYELIFAYKLKRSKQICEEKDAEIAQRQNDPFYKWVDSLQETGTSEQIAIIQKLKKHNDRELTVLARRIFDNLTKAEK